MKKPYTLNIDLNDDCYDSVTVVPWMFHGDYLELVFQELNGEDKRGLCQSWVDLGFVCGALCLDFGEQLRKLKEAPWADLSVVSVEGIPERNMIDSYSLPMWLATICPRGMSEEQQAKLLKFQRGLSDELRSHRQATNDMIAEGYPIEIDCFHCSLDNFKTHGSQFALRYNKSNWLRAKGMFNTKVWNKEGELTEGMDDRLFERAAWAVAGEIPERAQSAETP